MAKLTLFANFKFGTRLSILRWYYNHLINLHLIFPSRRWEKLIFRKKTWKMLVGRSPPGVFFETKNENWIWITGWCLTVVGRCGRRDSNSIIIIISYVGWIELNAIFFSSYICYQLRVGIANARLTYVLVNVSHWNCLW